MNKIYVGNLPYNVTGQDLEAKFRQYGDIEEAIVIKDRETGRSKGFGFVTFSSPGAATAAIEANGEDMEGRKIKVNLAQERTGGSGGGSRSRW
jgi:RNA recognition motif-containing protein